MPSLDGDGSSASAFALQKAMSIESASRVCMRVLYAGRVQGVGFRWTASRIARNFEVEGFVRNLADGPVELVAQGARPVVTAFLSEVETAMKGNIETSDAVEWSVQHDLAGFHINR